MGQPAGNFADDFVKPPGSKVHPPLRGLKLILQNFMYAFMIYRHANQNFKTLIVTIGGEVSQDPRARPPRGATRYSSHHTHARHGSPARWALLFAESIGARSI